MLIGHNLTLPVTMHVADTVIARVTASGHTRTVRARPDESLFGLVLRACRGKMGIIENTTYADITKERLVITAGTKAYNMCFVADQRATVQSTVPAHDGLCVFVHVKTLRQHMLAKNELFHRQARVY